MKKPKTWELLTLTMQGSKITGSWYTAKEAQPALFAKDRQPKDLDEAIVRLLAEGWEPISQAVRLEWGYPVPVYLFRRQTPGT